MLISLLSPLTGLESASPLTPILFTSSSSLLMASSPPSSLPVFLGCSSFFSKLVPDWPLGSSMIVGVVGVVEFLWVVSGEEGGVIVAVSGNPLGVVSGEEGGVTARGGDVSRSRWPTGDSIKAEEEPLGVVVLSVGAVVDPRCLPMVIRLVFDCSLRVAALLRKRVRLESSALGGEVGEEGGDVVAEESLR